MGKLINNQSLEKFKSVRKNLLKIAMWIFVGGVVTGVLFILFGGSDSAVIIGRIMGTLFLLAVAFAVSSNLIGRLEEDNAVAQVFAIIGIFSTVIAMVFWILYIWEAFPQYAQTMCKGMFDCITGFHLMYKITLCITYLASLGFFAANIVSIKEYDRGGALKPLKITSVICLVYAELYAAIMVFNDNIVIQNDFSGRLGVLAAFAGGVWIIVTIVALIVSHGAKKQIARNNLTSERELLEKVHKQLDDMAAPKNSSDAEDVDKKEEGGEMSDEEKKIREEIEKRVRAELIEREIREKVEAEMKAKKAGN